MLSIKYFSETFMICITTTKYLSTHENITLNPILMTLFQQSLHSRMWDRKVSFKCKHGMISLTPIKTVGTQKYRCLYRLNNRNLSYMSQRKKLINSLYQLW
jgi:hypothetical protein